MALNGLKENEKVSNAAQGEVLPPGPVPDHQLIRCIGRGSYGDVWLARNLMGSYRAVKIICRKTFKDERPFEREYAGIQKFEPLSRSHEGFVDVLHVGSNAEKGYFYYVMELGDDQNSGQNIAPDTYLPKTLAKELAFRDRLPPEECRRLALSLTDALGYLHKHGLVHRDIKPANIIFVDGVPKLADIGLVAHVDDARSYVGTEGYIPPQGPGTAQADIYSLGKVLYEISTGKDRHDFPALPDDLKQFADADGFLELNEIILQACQNDPGKRYQSAQEMHGELLMLESGKSIKRLRWLERQLALVKQAGVIALAAMAIGAVGVYHFYQERKQREQAAQNRQRQVGANVAYGTATMDAGDLLGALPSFVEALRFDQGDLKHEENHRLRIGSVLSESPKLLNLWVQPGQTTHARFGPEGRLFVIATRNGKAQIYDVQSGKPVGSMFGPDHGLQTASFSPDGQTVVTASIAGRISLWNLWTGAETPIISVSDSTLFFGAEFSPDGSRIVSAGTGGRAQGGRAQIWDARSRMCLNDLRGHRDIVNHAAYSKDGRSIVTASNDKTARIWDSVGGQPKGAPLEHKNWVYYAAFSPDGRWIVTACFDRKARVWNAHTGQQLLPVMNHGDAVRSAEFSPDGRFIVTAGWDSTVRLWDAETRQPLNPNPILYHSSRVMHATFHPAGHQILTACIDGTIRVWDLAPSVLIPPRVFDRFSEDGSRFVTSTSDSLQVFDAVTSNAVSPRIVTGHDIEKAGLSRDGRLLVVSSVPVLAPSSKQRELSVYDSQSAKPVFPPVALVNPMTNAQVSDNGRSLVIFGGSTAQLYDLSGGKPQSKSLSTGHAISSVQFSRDGTRLLTVSAATVQVWDVPTGRPTFPLLKFSSQVSHAEFSPNGRVIVICTRDKALTEHAAQLWDSATGKRVGKPMWHGDGVLHAAFSPDSRRIVTSGEDFRAIVWETTTGKRLTSPLKLRHDDQVMEAVFSSDGRWIVTASADRTARVWDAETGEPLTRLLRHPSVLIHARFIADGRRIMTQGINGESWLWDLPRDNRPLDDLTLLAHLLSREQAGFSSNDMYSPSTPLRALWQKLKSRYPSDFAVSRDAIFAWHRTGADACNHDRQWSAALFHLDHLSIGRPEDKALTKLREEIQRQRLAEDSRPH